MRYGNSVLAFAGALTLGSFASAAPLIIEGTGANGAEITPTVEAFRTAIGGGSTAGANGSFGGVRREINWDGVPDNFAAPNDLPANFFNVNSPRGVVLSTPGTGFQVSADSSNPTSTPVEFGNINPNYPGYFAAFSPERLFSPLGSRVTEVSFFVPGTDTPATVRSFGIVFTDVDRPDATFMEFYDATNTLILTRNVLNRPNESETFSFLGLVLDSPDIRRVFIYTGSGVLGLDEEPYVPGQQTRDKVVMDDWIYSEPVAVPEPAALALLASGALLLGRRTRRI